jgi:hypothetical protein
MVATVAAASAAATAAVVLGVLRGIHAQSTIGIQMDLQATFALYDRCHSTRHQDTLP